MAKAVCLDKFKDAIRSRSSEIQGAKDKERGFALLKDAMRTGIGEAGICAFNLNYTASASGMRTILGDYVDTSSTQYATDRDYLAQESDAACNKYKYRALAEVMADPARFEREGPELMLDMRLYCMSLLGKQAGIGYAMSRFEAALK